MDKPNAITVFAPATVANVTCGFDVMGFAIDAPGDTLELKLTDSKEVRIVEITGDEGRLPLETERNTAGVAVQMYLEHLGIRQGVDIRLHKQMPLGSGLGSSAASAVGGVYAINKLMGEPLKVEELLPFALEGERAACGFAHADNAAASLMGGFILVRSYAPLDVVRIPVPENLYITVIHPDVEVPTKQARRLLKEQVPLRDAVTQWGNVGGLIAGLMSNDYGLIGRSMQDVIVEPLRSTLIPGFEQVRTAAMAAGALGFGISGSGPSQFTFSEGKATADQVAAAMEKEIQALGFTYQVYVSKVNAQGPVILPEEVRLT
ncbi:homoserine kinase [Persicobacter psychrovividus]|uniref:Homoserine kinase n=1 Tax=Persicobacter psychrovividus TaxID=387638 RepID=A0ABN6L7Z2_9BACT|nr:homoserine kinase [Persicobacter psychrovividus]